MRDRHWIALAALFLSISYGDPFVDVHPDDCGHSILVKKQNLGHNQQAFNSDVYGGKAYERGVMAYGNERDGGGWWSVQKKIREVVESELKRKKTQGATQVEIVDIGSGPGYTLDQIKKAASSCCAEMKVRARGLEYNDKMVAYSREAYGVEVTQGDMHALSATYPAGSIDIINAQSSLWASDRPLKVVSEIAKIQKPGGIATFTWMVRRVEKHGYDNYQSWFNAFEKAINTSVAEGRINREQADGVLEANRQLALGNKLNSPRDPAELIELFGRHGYVLEEQTPQYLGEHGEPFFYQYVFRKKT